MLLRELLRAFIAVQLISARGRYFVPLPISEIALTPIREKFNYQPMYKCELTVLGQSTKLRRGIRKQP